MTSTELSFDDCQDQKPQACFRVAEKPGYPDVQPAAWERAGFGLRTSCGPCRRMMRFAAAGAFRVSPGTDSRNLYSCACLGRCDPFEALRALRSIGET